MIKAISYASSNITHVAFSIILEEKVLTKREKSYGERSKLKRWKERENLIYGATNCISPKQRGKGVRREGRNQNIATLG